MAGSRVTPNMWLGPPDAGHPFLHTRFIDPESNIRDEDLERPLYKYERNLVSGSEIRVLRIKPAEHFRDNLECTIEYHSLDDDPEFEALSYTWGSSFDHKALKRKKYDLLWDPPVDFPLSYPLYIDERLFWIGESLDNALRHIRGHVKYETNDLIIWVDAVCIDQNHEAEKNSQVQQMRRVYFQASTVIIWLGPSADDSDIAMDALKSMINYDLRAEFSHNRATEGMFGLFMQDNRGDEIVVASFEKMFGQVQSTMGGEEIPDFPIEAVASLLTRAWWGRVWVLQELAVAKLVTFVCGRKAIQGGDVTFGSFLNKFDDSVRRFGRPARTLDHRPWIMLDTRLHLQTMKDLMERDRDSGEGRITDMSHTSSPDEGKELLKTLRDRLSLKWLLIEAAQASLRAKMGQDHIYALLGLASDWEELDITINYSLSSDDVFANIPIFYLNRGDLWFLTYCGHCASTIASEITRSWVPDWTGPHGYETIASNKNFRRWNASKDQEASIEYVWKDFTLPPRLSLGGVVVDSIDWISQKRPRASQNGLDPATRATILDWVASVLNPPLEYRAKMLEEAVQSLSVGDTHHRPALDTPKGQGSWSNDRRHVCWSLVAGLPPLPSEDQEKEEDECRSLTEQAMEIMLSSDQASADEATKHRADCYFHRMMNMTNERLVFRTVSGRVGLGPEYIAPGDKVAIFLGAQTPFVIREVSVRDGRMSHILIGEAYVDGVMEGELFDGSPKVEEILLE
ncbi:hypothetical protein IFR05_015900 [Cadophora sp. M221]|nr:hypothetical protein IFR05_015900 [Cadophora sp. M221]